MTEKKVIAVVGATGAQGGGLVRAITAEPESDFVARAITRDPNTDKAKELLNLGAEVVAADIDDEASLRKAFDGAYGAYCVTFYWAHFSPEKELAEAATMARVARDAGLSHVIWSTLEDTRRWVPLDDDRMPTLMGNYKVPHFDAKGEANHFFTDLNLPTTILLTSFYWENFIYFGMGPKPDPEGRLALTLPMGNKRLAGIASEDIGKCTLGIFKRGQEFIDKTVGIAGELLTGDQMAAAMTEALGREVYYNPISPEAFRHAGFPGAEDLGNMFQFYQEFEDHFSATRDTELARKLNPSLQTFRQWLTSNADKIPLE